MPNTYKLSDVIEELGMQSLRYDILTSDHSVVGTAYKLLESCDVNSSLGEKKRWRYAYEAIAAIRYKQNNEVTIYP